MNKLYIEENCNVSMVTGFVAYASGAEVEHMYFLEGGGEELDLGFVLSDGRVGRIYYYVKTENWVLEVGGVVYMVMDPKEWAMIAPFNCEFLHDHLVHIKSLHYIYQHYRFGSVSTFFTGYVRKVLKDNYFTLVRDRYLKTLNSNQLREPIGIPFISKALYECPTYAFFVADRINSGRILCGGQAMN